jgi:ribosomal RNA-processing protein 1
MVWKGLFYCFWHSDKTPVQQELAQRLSNLVSDLKPLNVAVTFWETFLDTMAREWSSIDRLRLDKFMSLVRMFMHSTLKRMSNENWHPEVVVPMWDPLGRTLQRVNEGDKGHLITGLALHISHVFLDELEQVCINAAKSTGEGAAASSMNGSHEEDLPDTIPADVLSFFVEPFRNIMCTSNSRAVVERVVDSVYNKLVRKCVHCLTAVVENDDTEKQRNGYPFVQLEAALMAQELFDIAADPLTNQFNRDKVYDVIGRVEKLAEFQNSYQASLDQNANQAQSPKTPTKSKRSRKDKERVKLPKRGVVFQLKNNQVFKFHKKQQPKVTYSSVNSPTPTKGALKLKSKWPEVTRRSGTKKRR